jgi:hypothetical protein
MQCGEPSFAGDRLGFTDRSPYPDRQLVYRIYLSGPTSSPWPRCLMFPLRKSIIRQWGYYWYLHWLREDMAKHLEKGLDLMAWEVRIHLNRELWSCLASKHPECLHCHALLRHEGIDEVRSWFVWALASTLPLIKLVWRSCYYSVLS